MRKMRIAHINNVAGVASSLATYQRKAGHETEVLVFNPEIYKRYGGTFVPFEKWPFKTMLHSSNHEVLDKLGSFDVWHYHYPYGRLKHMIERELRRKGKDVLYLKHYHGSDIRESGSADHDFCLVSTPDLLKYTPNGVWLPNPIDFNEIEEIQRSGKIAGSSSRALRVAHYPYYESYKETDYHSKVLTDFEKDGKIETILIKGVPHRQALQLIKSADIVMGKILPKIGWFGKTELEALSMSKPVMAYVSDELYEKYRPPIFRTSAESLRTDLEFLISDEPFRDKLGRDGQKYTREIHSAEKIAQDLDIYYQRV